LDISGWKEIEIKTFLEGMQLGKACLFCVTRLNGAVPTRDGPSSANTCNTTDWSLELEAQLQSINVHEVIDECNIFGFQSESLLFSLL
jgi:hypothetical protein